MDYSAKTLAKDLLAITCTIDLVLRMDSESNRMMPSHEVVFWSLAIIQLLGIASCFATRLVETTTAASHSRHMFAACLGAVCIATIGAMYCGSHCWASSGATLCIMSVGATIDFRGHIEPSAF